MEAEPPVSAAPPGTRRLAAASLLWRLLLTALAIAPAIFTFELVRRHGVNVPCADEFTLAPLLVKAHAGAVTFSDLFAQHNEHRCLVPNLFFIAFAHFARGDVRAGMIFSVLLCGVTSVALWLLVRQTVKGSPGNKLFLALLINLLLFSPVQAGNWTWGFQFSVFLTNFLLVAAIVVSASNLGIAAKFSVCLLLAVGATYSFGNGLLIWVLSFPLIALQRDSLTARAKIRWLSGWAFAAFCTVTSYFIGYVKPAAHPAVGASINPIDYYLYIAGFLGAHLSRAGSMESILQPVIIGTILLVLYIGALAHVAYHFRDADLLWQSAPWLALGAYTLLSAALAALARIGFGVSQALDSRYTSFSLYLSISVIGLVVIIGEHLRRTRSRREISEYLPRVELALSTGLLVLSLIAYSFGLDLIDRIEQTRLRGKGALLFANVLDSGRVYETALIANAHGARMLANMLDEIGLMRPPMIKSLAVQNLHSYPAEKFRAGFIDEVTRSGEKCEAKGWAFLPNERRIADCVLLSYDAPGAGATLFRIADVTEDRPDVARVLHHISLTRCGWRCHFERSALPAGAQQISAWAFDSNCASLFQLRGPQLLP
jgi:hypothetical protein